MCIYVWKYIMICNIAGEKSARERGTTRGRDDARRSLIASDNKTHPRTAPPRRARARASDAAAAAGVFDEITPAHRFRPDNDVVAIITPPPPLTLPPTNRPILFAPPSDNHHVAPPPCTRRRDAAIRARACSFIPAAVYLLYVSIVLWYDTIIDSAE